MRYRLPSLNALRAFEAAGRRGSLSGGAIELGVSVGAVSRHVALLEAHFGCALLERHRSGVRLTASGAAFLASITEAFDTIDRASRALAPRDRQRPLKLCFYTSFATEWLAPRLPAFRAAHPDVALELRLATSEADFDSDFDLAMTATPPKDDRFYREELFDPGFALVCAPALITGPARITCPADLVSQTLLVAPRERDIWPVVLNALGAAAIASQRVLEFETLSLTYQAARGGAGVALGMLFLITDDLASGRLTLPFHTIMQMSLPHYLVIPRDRLAVPGLTAFRKWLMDEAAACSSALDHILSGHDVIRLPRPAPASL